MRHVLALLVLLSSAGAAAQTPPAQTEPPATTTTTVPMTTPTALRNAEYVLGPGDSVKVTVFDEPVLTGTFRVDGDGTFSYPLLDRVQAGGRRTGEIRDEIQKRLAEGFVQRPQVTVEIDQFRQRQVSVVGQVRSPGRLTLIGQMTLLEALAQAGYLTPEAGTEIHVLHDNKGNPLSSVTTVVQIADLQGGKADANIVLRENDLIIVNRSEKFTVSGHVRSSGKFEWERNMTVRVALALAGGITEKGSTRGIRVYREVKGVRQQMEIGVDDLVQPNDIIEVRQRRL